MTAAPDFAPPASAAKLAAFQPWRSPRAVWIGCLSIAVVGFASVAISTRWGAGVSPDSTDYVAAATSLLHGRGVSTPAGDGSPVPMTLWPPLYPLFLALTGALGFELHAGARWLNALLYVANLLLAAAILLRGARAPAWLGWVAAAGLLVFSDVLTIHAWIWSEPTFLFFGLSSLLYLMVHLRSGGRLSWWLSSVLASGAFFTRFAGAAFVATGVLSLLFFGAPNAWKSRVRGAIGFALVGGAPMAAWMLRNRVVAGSLTERAFAFYRLTTAHARQALDTATGWIWPAGTGTAIADLLMLLLFLVGAVLLLGIMYTPRRVVTEASASALLAARVLGVFMVSYALILLFSKSIVDPDFPFDFRILSPLHIGTWLFTLCALAFALGSEPWQRLKDHWARAGRLAVLLAGLILASMFILQAAQSAQWASRAYIRGLGYASKSWQESTLLDYLRTLPEGIPVFSNGPDVILDRTERPSYRLPARPKAESPKSQSLFVSRLQAMEQVLEPRGGLIVYFNGITWRNLVSGEDLLPHLPLRVLFRSDQGIIYQAGEW